MSIEKALTKLGKTNKELANKLSSITVLAEKPLPKKSTRLPQYLKALKDCGVKYSDVKSTLDYETDEAPYMIWHIIITVDDSTTIAAGIKAKEAIRKLHASFDKDWAKSFDDDSFSFDPFANSYSMKKNKRNETSRYKMEFSILENNPNHTGE